MNQNNLRIMIFLIATVSVLTVFNVFLSSGAESFFMSVPIWAILGFVILKYPSFTVSRKVSVGIISNVLLLSVIAVGMFLYLEKLIFGKVIWGEVFLAVYFLISVGIVIVLAKFLARLAVRLLSQKVKIQYVQKGIYWTGISLFWIFIILPFMLETFALHRPKIGDRLNPTTALGLSYENTYFKTKDDVLLHGWFIPAQSDKAVIIGHGLGANKSNFLIVADFWHSLGFNVLIFDFRGHGQSQGHTISLGYKERLDIQAGLDYLSRRQDVNLGRIIGYGVSFGGAAMIQAAAEDLRLQAIIIDSAYASVDSMALQTVERIGFVPPFLVKIIANIGLSMASLECGFDLQAFSPERAMAKIKQPVLFLHGKKDTLISWKESEKLFASAHEPKFLHYFETEGHYTTMNDPNYKMIVSNFLENEGH